MWGAKMRETQSGIPIWIKTRFNGDSGFVLKVILVAKNDEKIIEKSMELEEIPGETPI